VSPSHLAPCRVSSTHAYLRDLHSFPTRRSSDLTRSMLERMADDDSLVLARCVDGDGRTLVANLIYRAHAQGYFLASVRPSPSTQDRKSTRLNSSHGSTSYAVLSSQRKTIRTSQI